MFEQHLQHSRLLARFEMAIRLGFVTKQLPGFDPGIMWHSTAEPRGHRLVALAFNTELPRRGHSTLPVANGHR
ncbi:hypothetical protein LF1_20310 [Rubripirellula obstinata]|uniref:Uncharacterized protein n=1 Tax=Rubripirellula obstinata TaxID=406547 RepID=A0A5B1CEB9_9BACT|nr:hypothetical protein LF1_20310 [Rubripirellula obstinata]